MSRRALLDINILIALFDPDHVFHQKAHDWWGVNSVHGWASCPISENGMVRIMSNPNYSQRARLTPSELISRLQTFAKQTDHEFWSNDVSLCDTAIFSRERILGSRHLTDIYLLATAVHQGGRLATFDRGIPTSTVTSFKAAHLCVIG